MADETGTRRGVPWRRGVVRVGVAAAVLSGLAGVFLGVSGYTFVYARGYSYLSDDPGACVNCHIMREQYDGWAKSSHHARATCNDCHVPHDTVLHKYWVKAEHGYRHSKGFTFQDFHEPIRMKPASRAVVIDNCVRCHETVSADIRTAVGGGPSSGSHGLRAGVVADCIHCHASVAHGPTR